MTDSNTSRHIFTMTALLCSTQGLLEFAAEQNQDQPDQSEIGTRARTLARQIEAFCIHASRFILPEMNSKPGQPVDLRDHLNHLRAEVYTKSDD